MDRTSACTILRILISLYQLPDSPRSFLKFENQFQILVLTILSAQTTDRIVNAVRENLFLHYPTPRDLARAQPEDVEEIIKSCGFYKNKAKHIIGAAKALVEEYDGNVPANMDALLTLPGVGRKTANIVLNHAFGIDEGIAVDTHVRRVAWRLGMTDHTHPDHIERDLMALFPKNAWGKINYLLIMHGRTVCSARMPSCDSCPLNSFCRYYLQVFLQK
ncbi:MAG TPA: endonuclease III [Methanoregulaceae archaeon]|nr:endonuclease III [Methanoregulaceae archaeon]